MDNPFPRYDLFSCELGMENDGYDDNNDNDENITIGSLEDFADLIFFLFSWNAFKNPNGIIDGRPKTCFWLRPAVYQFGNLNDFFTNSCPPLTLKSSTVVSNNKLCSNFLMSSSFTGVQCDTTD